MDNNHRDEHWDLQLHECFFFADYMCFVCRLADLDQVTNNGFLVRSWFVDFTLDIENNHNGFI